MTGPQWVGKREFNLTHYRSFRHHSANFDEAGKESRNLATRWRGDLNRRWRLLARFSRSERQLDSPGFPGDSGIRSLAERAHKERGPGRARPSGPGPLQRTQPNDYFLVLVLLARLALAPRAAAP